MPLPSRAVKAQHACKFSRPVLPKLQNGQAVRRQILAAAPPRALASDQDADAAASTWSRAVDFMKEQAPKFMAAMMVAAMLVRIRHSDCSSTPMLHFQHKMQLLASYISVTVGYMPSSCIGCLGCVASDVEMPLVRLGSPRSCFADDIRTRSF